VAPGSCEYPAIATISAGIAVIIVIFAFMFSLGCFLLGWTCCACFLLF
jgi:hypothetical protein